MKCFFERLPGKWKIKNRAYGDTACALSFAPTKYRLDGIVFRVAFTKWGDAQKISINGWNYNTIFSGVHSDPIELAANAVIKRISDIEACELHCRIMSRLVRGALRGHPWIKKLHVSWGIEGFHTSIEFISGLLPKRAPRYWISTVPGNRYLELWRDDGHANSTIAAINWGDPEFPKVLREQLHFAVSEHLHKMVAEVGKQMRSVKRYTTRARNTLKAGPKKFKPQ
jgi:hypothetical protein